MKKLISIILSAAMLLSGAAVAAAAADEPAAAAPAVSSSSMTGIIEALSAITYPLNIEQKDPQGIYYTLDEASKTAIVGKNTYSDTASAGQPIMDSIIIPAAVTVGEDKYTVVGVGRNAFDGTALKQVTILAPGYVGEFAFAGCTELETAYVLSAEIKGFAFWGCAKLNQVNIITAESIGGGAFWNCGNLLDVTLMNTKVIMEKAFEGCGLDTVVFLGDTAPAVAAGALGSAATGYIMSPTATGYENVGLTCVPMTAPVIAAERVYAKAGETVDVAVYAPTGVGLEAGAAFVMGINLDEGLTVVGVKSGIANITLAENAAYENGALIGTLAYDVPGMPIAILEVAVGEGAAAGAYAIELAPATQSTVINGSVTICDHANTETVTVKSASCEEAGEAQTVCAACREVIETKTVDAIGHEYTTFVIEATCTEDGYSRHICQNCSHSYSDAEVEAKGHSWNEGEVVVQASTSKEGLLKYTCTECGTSEQVAIPKIVYGDANQDGNVNLNDASIILQAIANWDLSDKTYNVVNADANGDGKVVLGDVSLLLKYIAQWDVVLGPVKE